MRGEWVIRFLCFFGELSEAFGSLFIDREVVTCIS